MAIEQGTQTLAVTTEERTWKVEVFCEKGADPIVRIHRQLVRTNAAGEVLSVDNNATVERRQSEVGADSITATGVTVTGNQLAALVSAAADQWRTEDLAAIPQELAE